MDIKSIVEEFSGTGITEEDISMMSNNLISMSSDYKQIIEEVKDACNRTKEYIYGGFYFDLIELAKSSPSVERGAMYNYIIENFDRTKLIKDLTELAGELLPKYDEDKVFMNSLKTKKFCVLNNSGMILKSNDVVSEDEIRMPVEKFDKFKISIYRYNVSVIGYETFEEMNLYFRDNLGKPKRNVDCFKECDNLFELIEMVFDKLETNRFSRMIFSEITKSDQDKSLLVDYVFEQRDDSIVDQARKTLASNLETTEDVIGNCFKKLRESFKDVCYALINAQEFIEGSLSTAGSNGYVLSELHSKFNSDGE